MEASSQHYLQTYLNVLVFYSQIIKTDFIYEESHFRTGTDPTHIIPKLFAVGSFLLPFIYFSSLPAIIIKNLYLSTSKNVF